MLEKIQLLKEWIATGQVVPKFRNRSEDDLTTLVNQLEIEAKNLPQSCVSVSVLEQIRQAFADYERSEGCDCCRNNDAHEKAEKRLAELLNPLPYDDGSGFDWSQCCSKQ
jgi:DNA-directed RNA polymerase subunit H (RpoH/RPB5)